MRYCFSCPAYHAEHHRRRHRVLLPSRRFEVPARCRFVRKLPLDRRQSADKPAHAHNCRCGQEGQSCPSLRTPSIPCIRRRSGRCRCRVFVASWKCVRSPVLWKRQCAVTCPTAKVCLGGLRSAGCSSSSSLQSQANLIVSRQLLVLNSRYCQNRGVRNMRKMRCFCSPERLEQGAQPGICEPSCLPSTAPKLTSSGGSSNWHMVIHFG